MLLSISILLSRQYRERITAAVKVFDLQNTVSVGSNPARRLDDCPRFFLCFCCPVQLEAMSLADPPPKESWSQCSKQSYFHKLILTCNHSEYQTYTLTLKKSKMFIPSIPKFDLLISAFSYNISSEVTLVTFSCVHTNTTPRSTIKKSFLHDVSLLHAILEDGYRATKQVQNFV